MAAAPFMPGRALSRHGRRARWRGRPLLAGPHDLPGRDGRAASAEGLRGGIVLVAVHDHRVPDDRALGVLLPEAAVRVFRIQHHERVAVRCACRAVRPRLRIAHIADVPEEHEPLAHLGGRGPKSRHPERVAVREALRIVGWRVGARSLGDVQPVLARREASEGDVHLQRHAPELGLDLCESDGPARPAVGAIEWRHLGDRRAACRLEDDLRCARGARRGRGRAEAHGRAHGRPVGRWCGRGRGRAGAGPGRAHLLHEDGGARRTAPRGGAPPQPRDARDDR
mmetsp:Transcript_14128/g.59005  ORF Transcript_14128/g.59005 Transcript_14128/m.59005 type:complete len:282 (+) Transcript_14128:47-892(+)